jgi:hypothetical protein
LVFDHLFFQVEVTTSGATDLSPGTRCRYAISSREGEPLDVELSLASSSNISLCCNTGLRKLVGYTWSACANGIEMQLGGGLGGAYVLPVSSLDGGAVSVDASID